MQLVKTVCYPVRCCDVLLTDRYTHPGDMAVVAYFQRYHDSPGQGVWRMRGRTVPPCALTSLFRRPRGAAAVRKRRIDQQPGNSTNRCVHKGTRNIFPACCGRAAGSPGADSFPTMLVLARLMYHRHVRKSVAIALVMGAYRRDEGVLGGTLTQLCAWLQNSATR